MTESSVATSYEELNCGQKSHTCPQVCHLAAARNCDSNCHLDVDHEGPHRCSVAQHFCAEKCEAGSCRNKCNHLLGAIHEKHSCDARQCQQHCSYDGCAGTCTSDDHFHAVDALHSCGQTHTCHAECSASGVCDLKVQLETTTEEFVGAKSAFTYVRQANNKIRKKCAINFQAGCADHKGEDHRCDAKEHTCNMFCPCCGYYCTKPFQHTGSHATTHGNMANTTFVMDADQVVELEKDRKYVAGDRGVAEMCPFFCAKLGRGHVHYVPCEHASAKDCINAANGRCRHSKMTLASNPTQAMDEMLHDEYWKSRGWEDPVASALERKEYALCPFECDAPEHKDENGCKSHCILGAWHEPVVDVSTLSPSQSLVQGHVFNCQHFAKKGVHHHIFVLDASGSMSGEPWKALTAAFHAYIAQLRATQSCADIVSVVTFDNTARIVHEGKSLVDMTNISLPFSGGGTRYDTGLRCASEVLSRNVHDTYTPVILFLSDGEPFSDATGITMAEHIATTYSKHKLQSSCVGFGKSNFAPLKNLATHLGGTFTTALSGSDLLTTFKAISVAVHINAGLMVKTTKAA